MSLPQRLTMSFRAWVSGCTLLVPASVNERGATLGQHLATSDFRWRCFRQSDKGICHWIEV
jgi:hypothetical protein